MTKIKICGLSRLQDIKTANLTKPDYIGFVFAESKRKVNQKTAMMLRNCLHPDIKAVGVFVDEDMDCIEDYCHKGIIDLVQLHGNEDFNYIAALKKKVPNPIIKAVRVLNAVQILDAQELPCDYLLLDTYTAGKQGGTGEKFDWNMIPPLRKPYFLAGGIDGNNVLKAAGCNPFCVDVSSGAETEGYKDPAKMKDIIAKIRSMK